MSQKRPLPRELHAAAVELSSCLAELSALHQQGPLAPPMTRTRDLMPQLLQALRGVLHFEGGHASLSWRGPLTLNQHPLEGERAEAALAQLQRGFGDGGLDGLVFRFLPDPEQLRYFFRRLRVLRLEALQQLSPPGQLATLPGDRDLIGIQLLIGRGAAPPTTSAAGAGSGLGVRTAFEAVLQETGLDWIGHATPEGFPRGQPLPSAQRQRYCLGVYTNVVSCALRFTRLARDIHQRHAPLPFLALGRLVQQVARAWMASPALTLACVLLGARDPSPARRQAHTVILSVGLARFHALDAALLAEVGLTAFLHSLHERYHSFGLGGELRELEILRLLTAEQALTSLKVRAIHAAALVSMPRFWSQAGAQAPPLPTSAQLVGLCADLAAALDGSALGLTAQAPLPAITALLHLQQRHLKGEATSPYGAEELVSLARWLGPLPVGTVAQLQDGQTAVLIDSPGLQLFAAPLLDASGAPLTDAPLVALGRRLSARAEPPPLPITQILSARGVIDLAGRALFPDAWALAQPPQGELTPP
jgi:hypothetical protein